MRSRVLAISTRAPEETRRIDPRNGIALSALHDRAFDRGYIALDDSLKILVSPKLRTGKPTDTHRIALLEIEGQTLRLPSRFRPDPVAITWHRSHLLVA